MRELAATGLQILKTPPRRPMLFLQLQKKTRNKHHVIGNIVLAREFACKKCRALNDGNGGYGSLKNDIDKRSILANFLNEDIGTGDITSNALIDECIEANAKIVCKNDGDVIASGLS